MGKKAIRHGNKVTLPEQYNTLADMLIYIANRHPHKGITYVDSNGNEDFESYPALVEQARIYLAGLRRQGLKPRDVAILEIDNPKEFYRAFWACMFGGIIAAPVSKPTSWAPDSRGMLKFTKVWETLHQPLVIVEEQLRDQYKQLQESTIFTGLRYISTAELHADELADRYQSQPDDLAVLQFSSGSTGIPKGVQLTHRNIISNNIGCKNGLALVEDDVSFTWIPHTHDMGLFCQHLTPILSGTNLFVLTPYSFVRTPYLFLKKITEHKGTWFCCTNFGYEWMTQKVPEAKLATLDLSSLRLALNGAEPISSAVVQRFAEKFAVCGYQSNMMFPAYGMAEATVGITMSTLGAEPRFEKVDRARLINEQIAVPVDENNGEEGIVLAHEGHPLDSISLRIADEQGNVLDEYCVGEIQVQGESVTSGYYNREDLSAELFVDDWLRTGDLGFMVDGSLVVSGRVKDIIFVRGKNFFAHDLEEVVYEMEEISRGNATVVGLTNSKTEQEELLVFIKYKSSVEKFLSVRERVIHQLNESLGIETTHVIPIKLIPKTSSGKVQRYQLRTDYENGEFDEVLREIEAGLAKAQSEERVIQLPRNELEIFLHQAWSEVLNRAAAKISIDDSFLSLGGNSVKAYQLLGAIEQHEGREIGPEVLVRCKTIRETAEYLQSMQMSPKASVTKKSAVESPRNEQLHRQSINEQSTTNQHGAQPSNVGQSDHSQYHHQLDSNRAVAITGLALRLPNAASQEEFWANLCSKRDSITKISAKRKKQAGSPNWDDWIGELENIDEFDNDFFDITDEEAKFMDPQQRLLMETSYEALEDAGMITDESDERNIGVYVASNVSTYFDQLIHTLGDVEFNHIHQNAMVGNMPNIGAAIIAHLYNFTGPALAIDTACSSFLAALHHAVAAIRHNEVSGAVVGGANVLTTPSVHLLSRRAGICSTTNHTKVFDKAADGSIIGEGAVVVYLEPLTQAIQENKNIYGVIRGTAVNNDGYSLSIMAPNPKGQHQVLTKAYRDANLDPKHVGYIEAHGSGTTIGDPIEINALMKLFSTSTKEKEARIGIGSVKTNIGHLFPASSGASLAKVLLSMKHKKLAPSLHMNEINPALQLEKTPFYIVKDVEDWSVEEQQTRKAGISSFGLGGTNAHIVLEEWATPALTDSSESQQPYHLLTFSAKTESALEQMINETNQLLASSSPEDIANLCFTRNRYRKHYEYRAACVIATSDGAGNNSLAALKKGLAFRHRKARVSLLIGERSLAGGYDYGAHQSNSSAFYQSHVAEVSSTVSDIEVQADAQTNELAYVSYWHSFISQLEQMGVKMKEIRGAQSGEILADYLNEAIDLPQAADRYVQYGRLSRSASSEQNELSHLNADVVLVIGTVPKALSDACKGKIVAIEPESDSSLESHLLSVLSELYIAGANVDWERIYPAGSGKLVHLPSYPFERKSHWIHEWRGE
ncbi:AMP-binding protein [Paenibacillus sp. SC116]|uniref:beta-ketoacyl synthase N-terminal-like domain-containing protein n=1 Tax=Paenibacillus sp. SC116 TaxID=2968986 RepID=UPI00215B762F|nr:beta-ketoacyl synthase N-terminal-like domain-containing protein [Paenibacillus sp. SC116]MCR8844312.1 AMP-binding protein [Paenibacillus sp. SC116]